MEKPLPSCFGSPDGEDCEDCPFQQICLHVNKNFVPKSRVKLALSKLDDLESIEKVKEDE
jgi:hypothetical protein